MLYYVVSDKLIIIKSYLPRTRDISDILTRGAASPEDQYITYIPSSMYKTDLYDLIKEVFKHSFIYFEHSLLRFFEFCLNV